MMTFRTTSLKIWIETAMRKRVRVSRTQIAVVGVYAVELLVVIAIIGILVALLLPAIQSARAAAPERSASTTCDKWAWHCSIITIPAGRFPHGTYNWIDSLMPADPYGLKENRRCWFHDSMPYFEETQLFQQFAEHQSKGGVAYDFPLCSTPNSHVHVPGGSDRTRRR